MGKAKNTLTYGMLFIISSFLWFSPLMTELKIDFDGFEGVAHPGYSGQFTFSSEDSALGGSSAILNGGWNGGNPAQLTSGPFFSTYFLEKILSYSYMREKVLSRVSLKPFSQYIINFCSTPGRYFVFVLREIII